MDQMWAPWRMEYIKRKKNSEDVCVFCAKSTNEEELRDILILYKGSEVFVVMNLYPYTNGHILICSNKHTDSLIDLPASTLTEIMDLSKKSMEILKSTMSPDGFNFGANIGKAGGAGISDHIHFHLVPRWEGDTNFMPVIGQGKVIMEGLYDTYDNLKPHYDRLQ
jgi:ATP adenylyltransferase